MRRNLQELAGAQEGNTPEPGAAISAEEKIERTATKMTEGDRKSLADQIRETEANLSDVQSTPGNDSEIRRQNEERKLILQHDEQLRARGSEKDRLNNRRKQIEAVLKDKMPSKTEMWVKDPNEHARAVHHNLQFQEQYDPLCKEWQGIMTRLEPDDPYAHSLENIRPDK